MTIEYRPFGTKEIQGYDIFIDGTWHGSRRTICQCEQQVWWLQNIERIKEERRIADELERVAKQDSLSKRRQSEDKKDYGAVSDILIALIQGSA